MNPILILNLHSGDYVSGAVLEKEYVLHCVSLSMSLTFSRKNREINEVFSSSASGTALLDAIADVYNGVCIEYILCVR